MSVDIHSLRHERVDQRDQSDFAVDGVALAAHSPRFIPTIWKVVAKRMVERVTITSRAMITPVMFPRLPQPFGDPYPCKNLTTFSFGN